MFCTTSETEGEVGAVKLIYTSITDRSKLVLLILFSVLSCVDASFCYSTFSPTVCLDNIELDLGS